MQARRDGDGVDHYYSRVLFCKPTSRRTTKWMKISQLFIALLVWFFTPMILASIRRVGTTAAAAALESRTMGGFSSFHDSGWWLADQLKFHDALRSDFGFYGFVFMIVCVLVTAVTTIGFWFMIARRQFHRGLFETYMSVHALSLFINLTTQFPEQPGIVLHGAPFLQYAFGLAVEDAEPLFNARLCWLWVVMLHVRDHYNRMQRLSKVQSILYSILMFLATFFLVAFIVSTHSAYSAMIVITFFVAILMYFSVTLFPDRVTAWRKETETVKQERAVQRVENEVMMTENAFEVGAYEDEEDWSEQSVQGDDQTMQHHVSDADDDTKSA